MKARNLSIAGLMAGVAGVAVASAVLRNASAMWASALFSLDLALVASGIVLAVVRTGRSRGFWLGLVVFAGGYLAIVFGVLSHRHGTAPPPLITKPLVDSAELRIYDTPERDVYEGNLPGESLEPPRLTFQSGAHRIINGSRGDGTQGQLFFKPSSRAGLPANATTPIVDAHQFRRVAHALLALFSGLIGGLIGRSGARPGQTATQT